MHSRPLRNVAQIGPHRVGQSHQHPVLFRVLQKSSRWQPPNSKVEAADHPPSLSFEDKSAHGETEIKAD